MLFNAESEHDIEEQRERRGYLHLGKEEKNSKRRQHLNFVKNM